MYQSKASIPQCDKYRSYILSFGLRHTHTHEATQKQSRKTNNKSQNKKVGSLDWEAQSDET